MDDKLADKQLLIKKNKDEPGIIVAHGTGIKESRKTTAKTTVCFDEVLANGTKQTEYNIDLDKVSYEGLISTQELEQLIDYAVDNPVYLSIREIVRPKGEEPYVKIRNYGNVITNGDDLDLKPDELTINSLKFLAGDRERKYVPLSQYQG